MADIHITDGKCNFALKVKRDYQCLTTAILLEFLVINFLAEGNKMEKENEIKTKNRKNGYYFSGRACPTCGSKDTDTKCGTPCKTWFCYKCNKVVLKEGY